MLRFYEAEKGSILFDGYNSALLSKNTLRESISLVPQDPVIFAMSAMDNIRFSRPSATDQQVKEAAKAADAH